jgi:hypothetical protein
LLLLLLNLGSGAINVPGLQAASKVAIQIINIVKVKILQAVHGCYSSMLFQKIKANKADCEDL